MLGSLPLSHIASPEPKQDVPRGPSPDAIAAARDLVLEGPNGLEPRPRWLVAERDGLLIVSFVVQAFGPFLIGAGASALTLDILQALRLLAVRS
jgi:hypothetical protein